MAEQLDDFDWNKPHPRPGLERYDWDVIFNGEIWKIDLKETDSNIARYFRDTIRDAAKRRGVHVRIYVDSNGLDNDGEPYVVIQKVD